MNLNFAEPRLVYAVVGLGACISGATDEPDTATLDVSVGAVTVFVTYTVVTPFKAGAIGCDDTAGAGA